MNKKIEQSKIAYNALKSEEGMNRRDALKIMGLGGATMMMGSPVETVASESSDKNVKIVIVGGGAGGIMATVRLRSAAPNADITIIAPNEIHLYQPGQVFMAAGLLEESDIQRNNVDFIPDDVNWIKDEVTSFDPENNALRTAKNGVVSYDYLVVATGLEYDYEAIEGMSKELVGQHGISSVYLNDLPKGTARGGVATAQWFKDVRKAAQNTTADKPINVICTQPDTPIKCGGAPQKILYLSADFIRGNGPDGGEDLSSNTKFSFCKPGDTLFGEAAYNKVLVEEVSPMYGNIDNKFSHVLRKIDAEKKIATFENSYTTQGEYDEDMEEYEVIKHKKMVELSYDFIHIVPPMKAVGAVHNSLLGWQTGTGKGWLECDQYTLQHRRFENVFGIGDILGIPKGKTGGSARHHAPIMVDNLIAVIEGKKPKDKFDGYTVCPLKTEYGQIMLAEFDYKGLAPSFPILDPSRPRWMWWAFDLHMLKTMYWQLMMRGLM